MKIEGMMCRHCRSHCKKLASYPGVNSAGVSHEAGTQPSRAIRRGAGLKFKAVENKDYKVLSIA